MGDYSLEVVSHLQEFKGQTLKPYFLDGIDTIGVYGNEEFSIRFKNNTGNKVQVRLSVDGTDISTGKKAHTDPTSEGMWIVQPWGVLELRAWPETSEKGRAFIFTNEGFAVAKYTHGDLSNKGIIAAAVFVEGQPFTITLNPWHLEIPYESWPPRTGLPFRFTPNTGTPSWPRTGGTGDGWRWDDGVVITSDSTLQYFNATVNTTNVNNNPAVGASQELMQKIGTAPGLTVPKLDRTLKLRYLWWDQVKNKLDGVRTFQSHPTGFPGNSERKLADLGNTPTVMPERTLTF